MIACLVMTDGRVGCIDQVIPSLIEHVKGLDGPRVIHDDSGNLDYRTWLRRRFPDFEIVGGDRRGFGGAIRRAWEHMRLRRFDHLFATEDDFLFNRLVDCDAMAAVLDSRPHLQQLVLRRQAWNAEEKAAGGIIEQHPGDYLDDSNGVDYWVEHRRFFSTNPYLARRTLLDHDWPDAEHSEGVFTHQLLTDPKARFGFWGRRSDEPWVEHIGHTRAGVGY